LFFVGAASAEDSGRVLFGQDAQDWQDARLRLAMLSILSILFILSNCFACIQNGLALMRDPAPQLPQANSF
jgi:hypothetical protein